MAAILSPVPGGRLVACEPCRWEQFAATIPAAERAAREHDRSRHPAAAPETAGDAGLFQLDTP